MISKKFIGNTIREWEIDNMRIVRADVFALAKKANESFDIVFADPPYGHKRFGEVPQLIIDSGWLAEYGLVIVEHSEQYNFDEHPYFEKHKRYGSVNFSFFRKPSN
jgi:16S rRNA G966 N2-methylase RsmD